MLELSTNEFSRALPLLNGIRQKVLPLAIGQGLNPGRIFVDQRNNPRVALLWSPVGYYCLAGEPNQVTDYAEVSRVLNQVFVPASQARGESGFILIPSGDSWKEHLPTLLPEGEVIEIYRRPFAFDPARFAAQANWRERLPAGFTLQTLDGRLAEQMGVLASWASVDDFLAHGLGVALLEGDEAASVCMSVFASQTRIEIDVHTYEKYQRRGFAVLTAAAFIEACLQRGKQPNWECFWENTASNALANKLGFVAEPDYPVYYWEI